MNEEYDKIYYTNDKLVEQSEVQNLHTLLDLICLREESSWRSSCSSSLTSKCSNSSPSRFLQSYATN